MTAGACQIILSEKDQAHRARNVDRHPDRRRIGLGAIVFNFLLKTGTHFFMQDLTGFVLPPSGAGRHFLGIPLSRWIMIWIPALGGLISGLLVFSFAPEAEGHGTDAMIDSFHKKRGSSAGGCR